MTCHMMQIYDHAPFSNCDCELPQGRIQYFGEGGVGVDTGKFSSEK